MVVLNISIIIFVIMESANVLILYFAPDSRLGNGVAVFNPWFNLKEDKANELFSRYMVNWVAGTKLIFITLLLVILFTGTETTKFFAVVVMILSIASYYFRLHSIIKKMDSMGEITPRGYSKVLFWMITRFMLMFICAAIIAFLVYRMK